MKKEKIGFFGGSFNPPTNMHIHLAKKLIEDKLIEITDWKTYYIH